MRIVEDFEISDSSIVWEWDKQADAGWGLRKGDKVVNVRWLTRVVGSGRVYQYAADQTILLDSILVTDDCVKVTKRKQARKGYSLLYLDKDDHAELIRLAAIQEDPDRKQAKRKAAAD